MSETKCPLFVFALETHDSVFGFKINKKLIKIPVFEIRSNFHEGVNFDSITHLWISSNLIKGLISHWGYPSHGLEQEIYIGEMASQIMWNLWIYSTTPTTP